jgi:protein TonB
VIAGFSVLLTSVGGRPVVTFLLSLMSHRFLPILLLSSLAFCGCSKKSEPVSDSKSEPAEVTVSVESDTTAEEAEAPSVTFDPQTVDDILTDEPDPIQSAATVQLPVEAGRQLTPLSVDEGKEVLVQSPEPVVFIAPFYPLSKRMEGIEGQVVLQFVIDRTGRVVNPTVSASTVPEFNEYALEAVRDWRFLPALVEGKPVDLEVAYPVTFASEKGSLGAAPGSVFSVLDLIFDTYYVKGPDGYTPAEFEVTPIHRQVPQRPVDDDGELISGRVTVSFTVSTEGQVENAKVVESTATELEMPALTAIKYWQFIPRIREGKPVRGQVRQVLSFNPEEKE